MKNQEKANSVKRRFNTTDETKRIVWIQSAGHCEMCGKNLTYDYRVGSSMKWGEVAHILPASPQGPRGRVGHDGNQAQSLTNDCSNLMLLCPNCHEKIDRDENGYPEKDLSGLHQAYLARIQQAATTPENGKAIPMIVQSQHFITSNEINTRDLVVAMSAEGLTALDHPIKHTFRAPGPNGRDQLYWQAIKEDIQHELDSQLIRRSGRFGDAPTLALVGLADIPALIQLGQAIGDRSKRMLFSFNREHGLHWPDQSAESPEYIFSEAPAGDGPLALVLSISAEIPARDIYAALPNARIAGFSILEPSYMMVKNRRIIHSFRNELQKCLSRLEAQTSEKIHVFAAIPAALAIEFGALLTTEHKHPYVIFDRDRTCQNQFVPILNL